MEKLELKHLSPYLPYCVKMTNKKEFVKITIENIRLALLNSPEFKLILHPLSDLVKEIEVNGEKFVPLDIIYELFRETDLLYFDIKNIKKQPYTHIEKLFEWHFDVFGLIEKGLAVDVNTLNK